MSYSIRKMINLRWSDVKYEHSTNESKRFSEILTQKYSNSFSQQTNIEIKHDNIEPDSLETIIIIPDVHSYLRNINAFELCMESIKILSDKYNVSRIVQLGDLLECGELSQHKFSSVYEKIPSYEEEVEWAIDGFWDRIKKNAPNAKLIHLLGNHENRMHKYILNMMNKPSRLAIATYESLMPTELYKDMGVEVIPYGNENPLDGMYMINKNIWCVHGWSSSIHAAKAHLDKTLSSASIIFGHIHRIQSYVRNNPITGKSVGAWSFGSLAKNNMFYQKGQPNDHNNGFGIIQTDGNYFNPITIPILKDGNTNMVVLPNGDVLKI